MKNKIMPLMNKLLLRKKAVIENVNDQLENISQIEHNRHRSIMGFMIIFYPIFQLTIYNPKNLQFIPRHNNY